MLNVNLFSFYQIFRLKPTYKISQIKIWHLYMYNGYPKHGSDLKSINQWIRESLDFEYFRKSWLKKKM